MPHVPVGEDHVHGKVIDDLLYIEVLPDDVPLVEAFALLQRIDQRHDVVVSFACVSFFLVLADDPAFVPEDFVKVAVVADVVSTEEGAIRLLDQKVVAERPAILPEADVIALFGRHSNLSINFVSERLGQYREFILEDQVDGAHPVQEPVLQKMNLLSPIARDHLDEVEQLKFPRRRIKINKR